MPEHNIVKMSDTNILYGISFVCDTRGKVVLATCIVSLFVRSFVLSFVFFRASDDLPA